MTVFFSMIYCSKFWYPTFQMPVISCQHSMVHEMLKESRFQCIQTDIVYLFMIQKMK